jgi:hypothetical protein
MPASLDSSASMRSMSAHNSTRRLAATVEDRITIATQACRTPPLPFYWRPRNRTPGPPPSASIMNSAPAAASTRRMPATLDALRPTRERTSTFKSMPMPGALRFEPTGAGPYSVWDQNRTLRELVAPTILRLPVGSFCQTTDIPRGFA